MLNTNLFFKFFAYSFMYSLFCGFAPIPLAPDPDSQTKLDIGRLIGSILFGLIPAGIGAIITANTEGKRYCFQNSFFDFRPSNNGIDRNQPHQLSNDAFHFWHLRLGAIPTSLTASITTSVSTVCYGLDGAQAMGRGIIYGMGAAALSIGVFYLVNHITEQKRLKALNNADAQHNQYYPLPAPV